MLLYILLMTRRRVVSRWRGAGYQHVRTNMMSSTKHKSMQQLSVSQETREIQIYNSFIKRKLFRRESRWGFVHQVYHTSRKLQNNLYTDQRTS